MDVKKQLLDVTPINPPAGNPPPAVPVASRPRTHAHTNAIIAAAELRARDEVRQPIFGHLSEAVGKLSC